MAESFGSFVRQRRFWAILLFVLLYRFGEAMVTRTLPLFLKDLPANGGLGVSTSDVGVIVGTFGIFGIILGGVLGRTVIARLGLRRMLLLPAGRCDESAEPAVSRHRLRLLPHEPGLARVAEHS